MKRLLSAFGGLLLVFLSHPASAQSDGMVAGVTVDVVADSMERAGVADIAFSNGDPQHPVVEGLTTNGFDIEATLFRCDGAGNSCRGLVIEAFLPSTSIQNARTIEGSIEQSLVGLNGRILPDEEAYEAVVVLSTYLDYQHGISNDMLPLMLEYLLDIVAQSRDFMLSDDPAHAGLWQKN